MRLPAASSFAIGARVRRIDADPADSFLGRVLQTLDDPG